MKKTTFSQYAIDNSAILYLSLIRKDHTNTYRFTMTMTEEVCPDTLQMAVDRVYRRFPTIIAGFYPGFFHYFQIPAKTAPLVQPDPGCLITMTREEIQSCAFRVYYSGKMIIIEAFHALTDGFGAIASFTTLAAEYLRLKNCIPIPVCETLVDIEHAPMINELEDAYLEHEQGHPLHLPSRYAYQLPGGNSARDAVFTSTYHFPTRDMIDVAHRYGISLTALLSCVMADAAMEVQKKCRAEKRLKPVRIMVPVDLRRMFPSRTFRNFILYALPTMEPQDSERPAAERLCSFAKQLQNQVERSRLAAIMAYNVKTQRSWYFRIIPRAVKCTLMRLAYRYFGESNSSLTLTNLGNVTLPEEMRPFVENIEVTLTPRVGSPYNCAIISYNGLVSINISRFPQASELEAIFYRKLNAILYNEALQ